MTRVGLALACLTGTAAAQDHGGEQGDVTALAKTSQNPVGDLVSVPLQFNFNSGGGGLDDRTIVVLNVQPVVPIHLTPAWNLIARTIVPVLSVPTGPDMRVSGIGDIQEELFVSPAKSEGLIWGLGPIASVPTATLDAQATGSWAAGPAGLALWIGGPWVVGALATAAWTFADYGDSRHVGLFLLQPFANYNLGSGWAIVSAPIVTADWGSTDATQWTVPVGGGVSYTTHVGGQALSLGAQYYANLERPDGGTRNNLRLTLSFLFPTKP